MFRDGFMFGASMSGFQFEMGVSDDSIDENTDWYSWVHDSANIFSGMVSGDLPEDGPGYWDNYGRIHDLMRECGMNVVRIGLEWSRIFPRSTESVEVEVKGDGERIIEVDLNRRVLSELDEIANHSAIDRYKNMIEDAKSKGMKVILDLSHFTLPIWIHDPVSVNRKLEGKKGWVDATSVVEFSKYAVYMAWKFGDLPDIWMTMNEPQIVSQLGYLSVKAGFPPAVSNMDWYFESLKNQMQAHARAYELMKRFTSRKIGFVYSFTWIDGEDDEAIEEADNFINRYYVDGLVLGKVGDEMRRDLMGKTDIVGVNYYTRTVVDSNDEPMDFGMYRMKWRIKAGYGYSCESSSFSEDGRPSSDFGWEIYPEGLLKILRELKRRYCIPLIVTENGIADSDDVLRPYFLVSHLYAVEKALDEGVEVLGYLHWSIVDNYEWSSGYSKRFGLAETDYAVKDYHPRPSYYIFKEIIADGGTERFRNYLHSPYEIWEEEE